MSVQRIEDFGMELAAMLGQIESVRGEIAKMNAFIKFAEKSDNMQKAMEYTNARADAAQTLEVMEKTAAEFSGRADYEGAIDLMNALKSKLANLEQLSVAKYNMQTSFELAASSGSLDEQSKREEANEAVEVTKRRHETALALVEALVPARSSVLTLA